MRKFSFLLLIITILFLITVESCKQKGNMPGNTSTKNKGSSIPFDSKLIDPFIESYPDLKKYKSDLIAFYRKSDSKYFWFDEKGVVESATSLFNNFKHLQDDGISAQFPYAEKIDGIFADKTPNTPDDTDAELMLSCLYLFFADNVYKGIDSDSIVAMGWLLPRKEISYPGLLTSMLSDPKLLNKDSMVLFGQYYSLRDALMRYRSIEKNGGWKVIELDPDLKAYKPNDTAKAIRQIRDRLFVTGEIKQNNESNRYDPELVAAVKTYKLHNGYTPDSLVKPEHIKAMNVPVSERIRTITVNMERCRWLMPGIFDEKEFIYVNIPSYKMKLSREGNIVFDSPVVVGATKTKTEIFNGTMTYLIFSPYWNLPKSIYDKEIKPGIAKDTNYLAKHNMEWNSGQVRQKPGKKNSLGLVKFMFPNEHDIYFHDTPSKSYFKRENRALSHGCVRVGKPRELALTILKDNKTWTPQKIDSAMNGGKETICSLKHKIPVYILYFTSWVDEAGEINFYKDVYDMDERLAKLLIYKD
jgi:L,D-transpeptidase YcbB